MRWWVRSMLISEDPSLASLRKWLMSFHFTLKLDFKDWRLISVRQKTELPIHE